MLHTQSATTATPVRPSAQFDFLPVLFGADYLSAEASIFAYATKYLRDYSGGEWTFNQLPDGAGYLALEDERVFVSNPDNWFEGEMSGDAAGIFITAMVLNHRSWLHSHHDEEEACRHYVNRYEQLMAFVSIHREAGAIYRALD